MMSFCILPWVYCHNSPNPMPPEGFHRVTKAAKNATKTKMAKNSINY